MKQTLAIIEQLHATGVIGPYAVGGAVGAAFYLEPVATLDVDIFVLLTLVPKVSEALWERMREAKLRFGGGRVSMGTAFEVVVSRKGGGVSAG
jgi:hypothetical protein